MTAYLSGEDLLALLLTLKLALLTAGLLILIVTPIAWGLTRQDTVLSRALIAFLTLPLVLPPTVLGFYLLIFMGPQGLLGKAMIALEGSPLTFTFSGLVVGSMIYSLPFALTPLQRTFQKIGQRPLDVAATLGCSPRETFFRVVLPLARPGILSAFLLSFAHTLGEFGVVLMIGGSIPGQTQVISTLIYSDVEAQELLHAHTLSLLMLALSFVLLYWMGALDHPTRRSDDPPN